MVALQHERHDYSYACCPKPPSWDDSLESQKLSEKHLYAVAYVLYLVCDYVFSHAHTYKYSL